MNAESVSHPSFVGAAESGLAIGVRPDERHHVIELSGDLDLATAGDAVTACAAAGLRDVIVDLTRLDFMDCAGYRGLLEGRASIERRGATLLLVHAHGEPLRLLEMLDSDGSGARGLERCCCEPDEEDVR